jgi:hypothetical protein
MYDVTYPPPILLPDSLSSFPFYLFPVLLAVLCYVVYFFVLLADFSKFFLQAFPIFWTVHCFPHNRQRHYSYRHFKFGLTLN